MQLYASDALHGNCVVTLTRGVNEVAEAAAGYGSGVIYTHRPKKVIRSRLSPAECQSDRRLSVPVPVVDVVNVSLRQSGHLLRDFCKFLR